MVYTLGNGIGLHVLFCCMCVHTACKPAFALLRKCVCSTRRCGHRTWIACVPASSHSYNYNYLQLNDIRLSLASLAPISSGYSLVQPHLGAWILLQQM